MAQVTKAERERRDQLATRGLKWCPTCSTAKPFAEFYRKSSMRDGYRSQCKSCEYKAQVQWEAQNREHIRERDKKRYWENPEHARLEKRKDYYRHRAKRIKDVKKYVDPEKKGGLST